MYSIDYFYFNITTFYVTPVTIILTNRKEEAFDAENIYEYAYSINKSEI